MTAIGPRAFGAAAGAGRVVGHAISPHIARLLARHAASQAAAAAMAAMDGAGEDEEEDCGADDGCDEFNTRDTATCNAVTRQRGKRAGAVCHASAGQRLTECIAGGGPGAVRTPLAIWNN